MDEADLVSESPAEPLHSGSRPGLFWTTTNVGEAAPGVQTPLSLSAWQRAVGAGVHESGRAIGVFTANDGFDGDVLLPFYGRAAMSVDFLKLFGERMPGAKAEDVVRGFIGHIPEGMTFASTRRFHLNVLRCYPVSFVRLPRMLATTAEHQDRWWRGFVARVDAAGGLGPERDEQQARALLAEALERHFEATVAQCVGVFAAVQPVHDVLVRTVEAIGGDVSTLTAPVGGAETAVISDLWAASRGLGTVAEVVADHGFHGPLEGELRSRVWREDDRPVRRMVEQYSRLGDDEAPAERESRARRARARAEADLIAAAPWWWRPAVRALLRVSRRRLPLRGVAKRAMVQGFDAVRASARHLGLVLAEQGRIGVADDVFYLTVDELSGPLPSGVRDLVERRRALLSEYEGYGLPGVWEGEPHPVPLAHDAGVRPNEGGPGRRPTSVTGVGVSSGIVEGVARVVTDPGFADVEPGEVLVAPTTDPSWASIMFISAALVVDIGGALSHAAVVARELGLPCVVNTGDGTATIRTGDRVRVDGQAGTVEILVPVAPTRGTVSGTVTGEES